MLWIQNYSQESPILLLQSSQKLRVDDQTKDNEYISSVTASFLNGKGLAILTIPAIDESLAGISKEQWPLKQGADQSTAATLLSRATVVRDARSESPRRIPNNTVIRKIGFLLGDDGALLVVPHVTYLCIGGGRLDEMSLTKTMHQPRIRFRRQYV